MLELDEMAELQPPYPPMSLGSGLAQKAAIFQRNLAPIPKRYAQGCHHNRTRPCDKVPIPRLHHVVTQPDFCTPDHAMEGESHNRFELGRFGFDSQCGHYFKRPGRAQNGYIRSYFRLRPVVWIDLVVRPIEDHERARPEDPTTPVN